MRSLLLLGLARVATSFTRLAGVSPLEADGLVIVVAELSIELSKKVIKIFEQREHGEGLY